MVMRRKEKLNLLLVNLGGQLYWQESPETKK